MKWQGIHKARANCVACPVLSQGLCGALHDEEALRLSSVAWHRRFSAGQIIHAEGEKPSYFCAVVTGVVKLMKSLPNGDRQIVGLLLPGDFLGRPFGGDSRSSAVAATIEKASRASRAPTVVGDGSQPLTAQPACLRPRAIEVPMRPVPSTPACFMKCSSSSEGDAHDLGQPAQVVHQPAEFVGEQCLVAVHLGCFRRPMNVDQDSVCPHRHCRPGERRYQVAMPS